jgi:hypothetical protein
MAWWVMPYLRLCQFMVFLGIAPDVEHITANTMKGIKVNGKYVK